MTLVFAPPAIYEPERHCSAVASAIASMHGLEWTTGCEDIMGYDASCPAKQFLDRDFDCGTDSASSCQCGGTSQNSYDALLDVLGPNLCSEVAR